MFHLVHILWMGNRYPEEVLRHVAQTPHGEKKRFLTIGMSLIVVVFDLPSNVLLGATLVLAMNKNKHLYESF